MLVDLVARVALTAAQKTGATVATKVATSAAATFAGCLLQTEIMKAETADIQRKIAEGKITTVDEVNKAQTFAFGKAAVGSGAVAGVGLVANNMIADAIKNL